MAEPVISYPGAKWRFYPHMVDYFPLDMEVFIEPFLGGGSVSLSVADDPRFTKLERMIAGDLAPEMWAFWNGVKRDPAAVEEIATKWFTQACPHHEELKNIGFNAEMMRTYTKGENVGWENSNLLTDVDKANIKDRLDLCNLALEEAQKFWDWSQKVETTNMSLEERAARIILVNKISFSGMGDSGSLSADRFCAFRLDALKSMYKASKLLKRIEIYNVSFEVTMDYAKENPDKTFIFLDPPYYNQESSGLYGRNGDTHKGFPHEKFAQVTKESPAKWFVTYDDSIFVRKMFMGQTPTGKDIVITPFTIPGGYTMAQKNAEDALAGEEVFISNYDIKTVNEDGEFDSDF